MQDVDYVHLFSFLFVTSVKYLKSNVSLSSFLAPSTDLHKWIWNNFKSGHLNYTQALLHWINHFLNLLRFSFLNIRYLIFKRLYFSDQIFRLVSFFRFRWQSTFILKSAFHHDTFMTWSVISDHGTLQILKLRIRMLPFLESLRLLVFDFLNLFRWKNDGVWCIFGKVQVAYQVGVV